MYPDDPDSIHYPKPYADDLAELPPPIAAVAAGYPGYPGRYAPPRHHPILDALSGPVWLAAGMLVAILAMTSPGCVGTGGPTVSAKADLSVKETSSVVQLARVGGGNGEVTASLSIDLKWPGK